MNQATRSIILISSLAILPFCTKSLAATAAIDPARVVFIKADDFKGIDNYTQKWTDFLQASRDIGIQVGLGVIVEHIDGKASTHQWMRDQVAQGDVEFWNHGWDHNRTTMTDGTTVYEFSGTGLTHMREHMLWAQAGLKEALGQDAVTFGTPYNQFDSDAATVVNETTALRVLFSRSTIPLDARVSVVNIISELDGTGKPNAAKFEERYPSGPAGPVSLQFHPTAFDSTGLTEYTNIVQSLQDKGYTVMLPADYVAAMDAQQNTETSSRVVYNPLLNVDFEENTVGTEPQDLGFVSDANGNASALVVDSTANKAGTGQGWRLIDQGPSDYFRVGYNFVPTGTTLNEAETAVKVQADFARLSADASTTRFAFGIIQVDSITGSYRDRYCDFSIAGNGDLTVGSTTETGFFALNEKHTLTMYANDGTEAIIDYEGTRDLAANTVDFWVDGSYAGSAGLRVIDQLEDESGNPTTSGLGGIGFVGLSSVEGIDYAVDNISVEAIQTVETRDLLNESFESYTGGDVPAAARAYSTGDADNFISVVDGIANTAGTGNGVQIKDNSAAGTGLEYEFGSKSAVKVSFDFSPVELLSGDATGSFSFGVGQAGAALTSSTKRYAQFSMFNNGQLQVVFDGSSFALDPVTVGSSNNLTMYANDYDSKIVSYTRGETVYILPPNSVAWWVNGVLQRNDAMAYGSLDVNEVTAGGTVGTSEGNLARFGINTYSSQDNLNYVFDNFAVAELLVPPDWARLHNLFMDHMMLQRDSNAPIWGTGSPGAAVEVLLDDELAGSATVDAQGDWMVRLAAHPNDGGVSHTIKVQVGDEVPQVISDVIFGDVYLCSGQSNMEFEMYKMAGFDAGYSAEENPDIRHIAIQRGYSGTPLDEPVIERVWQPTTPDSIANFTAVGYMFAKELYARTGVPVGLLNSSYGGERIHRYVSFQGLEEVPELAGYLTAAEAGAESQVAYIYNAQIAPLLPFGICGILWYQGETDRFAPILYEEKMRALIRGWRSAWEDKDLPFYYCQLPTYNSPNYTLIRDGQLRALSEPGCGMAVTIDVGDDTNIHPANKQDPGFRLAQWALAKQYGFANVYSGPVVVDTVQEGAQIRVLFDYAEDGLMIGRKDGTNAVEEVSGSPLQCFEVAGSNRVFTAADAVIDTDTVLVSAPSVPSPQYVRYCYSDTSNGTNRLYNAAGLPAAAFRTDEAYELLVKNGTGSADPVLPGTVIPVAANAAPSGRVFDRWIGGGNAIADAGSASTTVTMPDRDLYLYATYRDSAGSTQTLTVNSGAGGGAAQAGTMMEISAQAAPADQAFEGWIGDTQTVVNTSSAFTMLQMPASNITVTATYSEKEPPPVPMLGIETIDGPAGRLSMWLMSTESGARYELEFRTNLVEGAWETVVYNIKSDGQDTQLALSTEGETAAFYRLKRR